MRQFRLLGASLVCGAAMLSAPAMAAVTGVFTTTRGSLTIVQPPDEDATRGTSKSNVGLEGGTQEWGSAAVFASNAILDDTHISFRNGGSTAGFYGTTTSRTVLDLTLTNDSGHVVTPVVNSTILGAGMGWFIGDKSCLDDINSCGPQDKTFGDTVSLQDFLPSSYNGNTVNLGGATFDFKITGGSNVLFDLTGSFSLVRDLGTNTNYLVTDLSAAQALLNNFHTTSDTDSFWNALWDPTDITLNFGTALGVGQSTTLQYETTVTSYTSSECLVVDACLIDFASFGDPIGRGGGTTGFSALSLFSFFEPDENDPNIRFIDPPEDDPLSFPATNFFIPTFTNGVLDFRADVPLPEPSTWLLMIGGMAIVGARLRARRRPLAVVGAW